MRMRIDRERETVFKSVLRESSRIRARRTLAPEGRFAAGRGVFFLLGVACTALMHVLLPAFHSSALSKPGEVEPSLRTKESAIPSGRHKPWGDFEYEPLSLEEPRDFLPSTAQPLGAPRWFFGDTREQVEQVFNTAALTAQQKARLLDRHCWQAVSNGIYVSPPPEVVLEMSAAAREHIYGVLDAYPANSAQRHPFRFRPGGFEEWLTDTGLGREQSTLLRKLTYTQAGSLCFCDGAIAQGLFSAEDFKRLVRALYEERTFLMKLRVTQETDIDALVKYWDHGGNVQARRPLLESLARLPGGGSINVMSLLPPFARLRLYTYPDPTSDPAAASENCFWTAMNFFNERPNNRFLNCAYTQNILTADYHEVSGPATFGDLIAVQDASGALIHLCVYLADEVVFTKNGRDSMEPWVLMKMPDILASYRPKESGHAVVFRANTFTQLIPRPG